MNFSKNIFAILFLSALMLVACQRDDLIIDTPTPVDSGGPDVLVEAGLLGRVLNENSEPVLNASVELAGQIIETDSNGVFFFNHLNLNEAGDFVKIEKSGYFLGSRRFYPTLGNENYVEIKLLPKTPVGTIDATMGGMVETFDGAMIRLPAGGIVDSDGNTFTGEVNVFAKFINPVADDLAEIMPGDLVGKNMAGTNVALETYGMLAVELESTSGQPLNLGNDKTAKLAFPLPTELQTVAPTEIPLWSLDEENGIWIEEGKASRDGDFYVGEVSHFSFWNCDDPFELVELEGCFIDENGLPLPNVKVKITNLTTGNCGFGMTDSDGCFKGKMPKGEPLKLELLSKCGVNYYSEDIGSFSNSENLGTIQATGYSDQLFTPILKGRVVDCNGDVMGDMILEMDAGGEKSYFSINGSGFEIPAEHCANLDSVIIRAKYVTDMSSEQSLSIIVFPDSSEQYVGDLAICSNDMAYLKVTINNDSHTYYLNENGNDGFSIIRLSSSEPLVLVATYKSFTPNDSSVVESVISLDSIKTGELSDYTSHPPYLSIGNVNGNFDTRAKFWLHSTEMNKLIINRIGGVGGFIQGEFIFTGDMVDGKYVGNQIINPVLTPDGGNPISTEVKIEFNLKRVQ